MNCLGTSNTGAGGCCNANTLCSFNGNLEDVVSTPIYVQSVYDAVRFHMNGMKTVQNLRFTPALPCGCTISRVKEIRCKKIFDPSQAKDCDNLTIDMETGISGATFLNDCRGIVETIGPDGIPSEKIIFADTSHCDEEGCGTPIFGTQNVRMWGNIIVYLDLCICDSCGRESSMTCCAEVNIASPSHPLVLTNFFELCMPSTGSSAFLPRLTELCNSGFTCRLATNNAGRDLCISPNGEISANLIVGICVTMEKKITVPVQLCVLCTGFAEAPLQENTSDLISCPGLFPERTDAGSQASRTGSDPDARPALPGCDPCSIQQSDGSSCRCGDFPPQSCR